jgi:hypothetical protein
VSKVDEFFLNKDKEDWQKKHIRIKWNEAENLLELETGGAKSVRIEHILARPGQTHTDSSHISLLGAENEIEFTNTHTHHHTIAHTGYRLLAPPRSQQWR